MTDKKGEIVVRQASDEGVLVARRDGGAPATTSVPAIVRAAGAAAGFAWDEFFEGTLANAHTRKAYSHAVRDFLAWAEGRQLDLVRIAPGDVGSYLRGLPWSVPTKKLRLAALRQFFDRLVNRHACLINPAATVRAERYAVIEGKTPQLGVEQARTLLDSIDVSNVVGLRDRTILTVLAFTAARVGAVAKLTAKSLVHDGTQYSLRFLEKGGKSREIPVQHELEGYLRAYIGAAKITEGPLFRSTVRKTKVLTKNGMTGVDICRMMKRRLKEAGLGSHFSPHSFRVTTVTNLLEQNVRLEDVQYLAGHSDPRTTRIYDRRQRKVTRNIVERISI
jgi:site-specific recombinase XerD